MAGAGNYDKTIHRRWDTGRESDATNPAGRPRVHVASFGDPVGDHSALSNPRQMELLPDPQGDLFNEAVDSMEAGR
jgi:hypothetical protein